MSIAADIAEDSPGGEELRWVADIGGSHVTAAVIEVGDQPRVIRRATGEIEPEANADEILQSITGTLRRAAPGAGAWTIALPGPFDYERGSGTFEGVAKFAALANVDLRTRLSAVLGVERGDVRFVNDAVAYGVGEWSASPHRAARFVCITLGTGVGSAFLDYGHPVESGREVPPHGWAHLLEIEGRPLEDFVSTRAIQRRYGQHRDDRRTVREIADRARRGEAHAAEILDAAMFELGTALAPWIARFGATETVVGGSMARSWDVLGGPFARAVQDVTAETVNIRASTLFDDAPLIGSAMLA
ncbi:ROK family protein [Humibacter albus]|uniref:ROK family protein n=1 Tax=Humibacter albus TaxID=427754 RepID=UPI0003B50018|nr:ROK family protein [Humibacter albus]